MSKILHTSCYKKSTYVAKFASYRNVGMITYSGFHFFPTSNCGGSSQNMVLTAPSSKIDVERTALFAALSNILNADALQALFSFLASNHTISMTEPYPLTRRQIERALEQYFKDGTNVIMREYDKKFYELVSPKHSAT